MSDKQKLLDRSNAVVQKILIKYEYMPTHIEYPKFENKCEITYIFDKGIPDTELISEASKIADEVVLSLLHKDPELYKLKLVLS